MRLYNITCCSSMQDDQVIILDDNDQEAQQISQPKKLEKQQPQKPSQKQLPKTQVASDALPELKPLQLTKQPLEIKVNGFEMGPSDLDLGNSFENLHTAEQYNVTGGIGYSVYMQNVNQNVYYAPPPILNTQQPPSTPPRPQAKLSIPKPRSSHEERQSKNTNFVKKSVDSASKSEKGELSDKNQRSSDSSLGIDIPAVGTLRYKDVRGSLSSNSDSGSNGSIKSKRCIEKFQTGQETNEVTFLCSDKQQYKKSISEAYLSYLQKYFFYNFSILLPIHVPQALEIPTNAKVYLHIYFDYIVSNHNQKLLEFFERSNFKEPAQQAVSAPAAQSSATTLQDKFFEYKNMIVGKIYQGMGAVESTIKKIKGEEMTPIRLLERLFFKQIEMAEKHQKGRQKLQNILGEKVVQIHPSAYEKGAADTKLYVLMCLRWLIGFELAIQMVKERQANADEVENQKLEVMLSEFEGVQERQKVSRMAELQQRVRSIYEV